MALTRSFKETILARVQRDNIKATVGFEQIGTETGPSPKSLIRMFGPSGNPQARNLFAVISHLQRAAGLPLHVTARSH
jgi:DNA-binding phage protein